MDNIKVEPGRKNAVEVATDDISGVHYPLYKIAFGADGTATLVNADNGLPVSGEVSVSSISGAVTLNAEQSEAQPLTVKTEDENLAGLLSNILKEMKIMNIHLSMMTDNEITKAEID